MTCMALTIKRRGLRLHAALFCKLLRIGTYTSARLENRDLRLMRLEELELRRIGAYTCTRLKNRDLRLHAARRA
ncbi:hypothetical protein FCV25MIE_19378 [Fagus crenata]